MAGPNLVWGGGCPAFLAARHTADKHSLCGGRSLTHIYLGWRTLPTHSPTQRYMKALSSTGTFIYLHSAMKQFILKQFLFCAFATIYKTKIYNKMHSIFICNYWNFKKKLAGWGISKKSRSWLFCYNNFIHPGSVAIPRYRELVDLDNYPLKQRSPKWSI